MTKDEWQIKLDELSLRFPIKVRDGLDGMILAMAEKAVGKLPLDLSNFYQVSNGLRCEWFNLLPLEDPNDPAGTWDGLKRANNFKTTKFLNRSEELLSRFLVIAEIGGGCCACIDRSDDTVWFEDVEGIHQTDLDLFGFIEVSLREVMEL